MPVFHIGGSSVTQLGCLSQMGTYVLAPGFDAGSMLELFESERGMVALLVPTMIQAMLEHPDFRRRDLSSVRTILSGAATVPGSLVRRVKSELDCDFSILFGSTEVNGVVTQTRLDDSVEDQAETLGRALPHADIKIADPTSGDVVPIGERGEICVRGYQAMAGYQNMPEETSQTIRDGWVHTGDLGVMDDRGYIRIVGRLKDMIIRGGMNISPGEIEATISELPAIAQVSVIGLPDAKWGEIVAAVVIPADPANPPSPDALNEHCRSRLADHKSPRYWYFVDELPLTPTGKVQKFELREWASEGRIQAAEWTPPSARP
jgi:fatty-acyl-CoA synthase